MVVLVQLLSLPLLLLLLALLVVVLLPLGPVTPPLAPAKVAPTVTTAPPNGPPLLMMLMLMQQTSGATLYGRCQPAILHLNRAIYVYHTRRHLLAAGFCNKSPEQCVQLVHLPVKFSACPL